MRRPKSEKAVGCDHRRGGGGGRALPQHDTFPSEPSTDKQRRRHTQLAPLSRSVSPQLSRSISPAPLTSPRTQSPRAWPTGVPITPSARGRTLSEPHPQLVAHPMSAVPPSYAQRRQQQQQPSPRILPPPDKRRSLPQPQQQQQQLARPVSPRAVFPVALPETYRVKMHLNSPQPQPQFVPATDGPKAIHHPGARTRTSQPVHVTLGLLPESHIGRAASPCWENLPTAPVHLVRFKQPHLLFPGQDENRQPTTPREDRPDSAHRRGLGAGKRGGFFRRFLGEKNVNNNNGVA